jgi:hypothetical protein
MLISDETRWQRKNRRRTVSPPLFQPIEMNARQTAPPCLIITGTVADA